VVLLAVELGSESGPGVLHLLRTVCAHLYPGLQFTDDAVSCQPGSLCLGHTAPKQIVLAGQPVCVLCCAVLCCAVLCCAVLCCAVLCYSFALSLLNFLDALLEFGLLVEFLLEHKMAFLILDSRQTMSCTQAIHKYVCTHVSITFQKWIGAVVQMS